jgi:hypothetical protein
MLRIQHIDDDCGSSGSSIRSTSTLATTMTTTTKAMRWSKTTQAPPRGGSISTNVVNNGWGCRFLRVATKAILNGKGDADDNLQDDAATNIFSDIRGAYI